MIYPKASKSNIAKWGLENLNIRAVEAKLPSEVVALSELENTMVIVNGDVVANTTGINLTEGEFFQQKDNDLLDSAKVLAFNVVEAKTFNVINYIYGTDLDIKLVFNVMCDGAIKVNEYTSSNNAEKIKYNLVINNHGSYSDVVYTSVTNTFGAKMYVRYDLYTHRSNSSITLNHGGFNDSDVFVDIYGEPKEWNSTVNANNYVITNDLNECNLLVKLVNVHKGTNTDIKNYVVASGNSKIIVDGIGKIEKGMSGSTAYQTSRGLILSEYAECHTNPILLIEEYDVKAGHGATVGRIDEEHLYYLMSRGLTKVEASSLIVHGYVNYLYEYINSDLLKDLITEAVQRKLK